MRWTLAIDRVFYGGVQEARGDLETFSQKLGRHIFGLWLLMEKSSVKNVAFSRLHLNFFNGLLIPRCQLNGESPVNSLTENSPLRLNGLSPLIR